jgi:hypothetical protein
MTTGVAAYFAATGCSQWSAIAGSNMTVDQTKALAVGLGGRYCCDEPRCGMGQTSAGT